MITTSSSKDAQLVSSWIHHEEQNVTIARIALFTSQRNNASSSRDGASSSSSSVSRSRASELLREVVSTDPDVVYRATWCDQTDGQQVDGVPCTVFQLVGEARKGYDLLNNDDDNGQQGRTLFALGLSGTSESLHVAHERDLAQCRDLASDHPTALVRNPDRIALSPHMQTLWQQGLLQQSKVAPGDDAAEPRIATMPPPPMASTSLRTKTTAASFFCKPPPPPQSAGASKTSNASATTKTSATVKPPQQTTSTVSKPLAGKENKKIPTKSVETAAVKKDTAAAAAAAKIGSADDFVGDMDLESSDDDDDEVGMDDPAMEDAPEDDKDDEKVEPISTYRGKVPPTAIHHDDEVDEDEPMAQSAAGTKTGAMDAFATSSSEKLGTRVRKRLVEKTFADEHGYIQTEMQEVWEEVPVEAPAPKSTAAPARPSAAKSKPKVKAGGKPTFKQGSLSGFFTKK